MNIKQKICLLVGIAAIVVMGLYPPWVLELKSEKRNIVGSWEGRRYEYRYFYTTIPGTYSWLNAPPGNAKFVDLYRLGVQFFIVGVATAGLMIILGEKKGKNKSSIENKSPMTLTRGFFFTLLSSVTLGFIIPAIIIAFELIHDKGDWDNDMLRIWFVGLPLFAGIWIVYGIIRGVIILSRWVAKRFRDV